jgi:uncharacterized phage protein gp47/JayE
MSIVLTADDWLNQMIVQARLLDPSFSGAVGSPEYKMFSSVAQTLAASQVNMTGLSNALNINSKVGSQLDQFTANFGMQRQKATPAQGYVVFRRPSPAPTNITISQGLVIQANGVNTNSPTTVQYSTSSPGTIAQGETASAPVPVQAVTAGVATNVPAGALNQFVGTIPAGVSSVSNPTAITNGLDPEDDDIFKSRFQNTWARNLSGTTSSYLAVALAGAFTTKAVCIGQQSTFIEYIQVPNADDAGIVNSSIQLINGNIQAMTAGASAGGLWTTALSDIPYAKNLFTSIPTFISDNGTGTYYYQQDVDYTYNTPPLLQGDALREHVTTAAGPPSTGEISLNGTNFAIPVESTTGFPTSGSLYLYASDLNWYTVTYTNIDINTSGGQYTPEFTGCNTVPTYGGTAKTFVGYPIYLIPTDTEERPNFTFTNINSVIDVATGQYTRLFDTTTGEWVTNSEIVNPADNLITVQTLTPGQVIQSEFRYVSTASRNNLNINLNNCIDVYVNGSNPQQTSCVFMPPSSSTNPLTAIFTNTTSSPFYVDNFRRDGEPERRPNIGNHWTPLFNPPITSLPASITGPDGATFFLDVHYWLVHEIDELANSIRGRDGIEWSYQFWGDNQTTPPIDNSGYLPGGDSTSTVMNYGQSKLPIEVDNYSNDANIINMQATYDAQSPVTTDVLAHGAKIRYFKFDVTLMYAQNAGAAGVQSAITSTLSNYLNNQYFGTIVQLSSILEQIGAVSGVQNVRWSNDLPTPPNQIRVIETDINGNPLAGVQTDRYAPYSSANKASFTLQVTGANFGSTDNYRLTWNDSVLGTFTTNPISYTASASDIQTAINTVIESFALPYQNGVTVTQLYRSPDTLNPYTQYLVTYATPATTVASGSNNIDVSTFTGSGVLNVASTTVSPAYPTTGTINVETGNGIAVISYTGTTSTTFTGCNTIAGGVPSGILTTGGVVTPPQPVVPTVLNTISQGIYLYNTDFFLMDDELPALPMGMVAGDTLPGLIAQTRAENTFYRPVIN